MILTAQSYHLKSLVQLGEEYYQASPYASSHRFEYDTLLDNLRRAMILATHNIVVAEWDNEVVGGCMAYVAPYSWNTETFVNVELIYVKPQHRGAGHAEAMLAHQESWANSIGAREIVGGDIGFAPGKMQDWLESQGYHDAGVVIRKVL